MQPVSEVIKQTNLIIAAISLTLFIIIGAGKTGCVAIIKKSFSGILRRAATGNLPFSINNLRIHENIIHEFI